MSEEPKNNNQKELPSSKIVLEKQIEIIKAFAVIYGTTGKGSSYKDVASKVGVNANNVSGSLKFWKDIGFLVSDNSGYVPSQALINFNQKIQWEPDSAWKAFHDAVKGTWFLNEITVKFQLKPKISSEELIKSLGMASGIQSKDAGTVRSLQLLIQLLELSKIIDKDSDGNYTLKHDNFTKPKEITVDASKDLIQIKIKDKLYAVDIKELEDFVVEKGKKLDGNIQRVE